MKKWKITHHVCLSLPCILARSSTVSFHMHNSYPNACKRLSSYNQIFLTQFYYWNFRETWLFEGSIKSKLMNLAAVNKLRIIQLFQPSKLMKYAAFIQAWCAIFEWIMPPFPRKYAQGEKTCKMTSFRDFDPWIRFCISYIHTIFFHIPLKDSQSSTCILIDIFSGYAAWHNLFRLNSYTGFFFISKLTNTIYGASCKDG